MPRNVKQTNNGIMIPVSRDKDSVQSHKNYRSVTFPAPAGPYSSLYRSIFLSWQIHGSGFWGSVR